MSTEAAVASVEAGVAAVSLESKHEEETFAAAETGTAEDVRFDKIVGVIEDTMMDPAFQGPQEEFCKANCDVFDESDENKLEYTTLFDKYTEITEAMLMKRLAERVEGFDMEEFSRMLAERKDQIAGDVFDMLLSFGDFDEFKSLMLSYKSQAAFEAGEGGFSLAPTVLAVVPAASAAVASAPAAVAAASVEA